jgi:hypothetical protein
MGVKVRKMFPTKKYFGKAPVPFYVQKILTAFVKFGFIPFDKSPKDIIKIMLNFKISSKELTKKQKEELKKYLDKWKYEAWWANGD